MVSLTYCCYHQLCQLLRQPSAAALTAAQVHASRNLQRLANTHTVGDAERITAFKVNLARLLRCKSLLSCIARLLAAGGSHLLAAGGPIWQRNCVSLCCVTLLCYSAASLY